MKKVRTIMLVLLLMVLGCCPAWASGDVYPSPTGSPQTLMYAQTSTGYGQEHDFGMMFKTWHCTVTWSGTTPTSTAVSIQFSDQTGVHDASGLGVPSTTISASPTKIFINGYSGRYVRANYISKVGGDGTTAVTMSCTPMNF